MLTSGLPFPGPDPLVGISSVLYHLTSMHTPHFITFALYVYHFPHLNLTTQPPDHLWDPNPGCFYPQSHKYPIFATSSMYILSHTQWPVDANAFHPSTSHCIVGELISMTGCASLSLLATLTRIVLELTPHAFPSFSYLVYLHMPAGFCAQGIATGALKMQPKRSAACGISARDEKNADVALTAVCFSWKKRKKKSTGFQSGRKRLSSKMVAMVDVYHLYSRQCGQL